MAKPFVRVSVKRLEEEKRKLSDIKRIADDSLKTVKADYANRVVRRAKDLTPTVTGRARNSIRIISGGAIQGGDSNVPYFGWLDFGGDIFNGRGTIKRPYIKGGRIIYPALREEDPELEKVLGAAVAAAGIFVTIRKLRPNERPSPSTSNISGERAIVNSSAIGYLERYASSAISSLESEAPASS